MHDEATYFLFRGRVQGVFFRATAKEIADRAGIKGFVRNLPGGEVELLAQGTQAQRAKLEKELLSAFCCTLVKKESRPLERSFDGFKIEF
ncbi:MAG: hypothetical protein A2Y28_03785 [Chlamydiae bacterium GWC2_50_10]|nr:MAG: hypothetical protein A2Z85_00315 [Chlamydiae bacterium GWA2_50_15]OGN54873.1 MAG: hypothetical protein A2Y28_03785 [Chlamydiae bacterium GWC2_50_10]OGN55246.1 MAG: hypothetical protein A2098_03670 [Chlamydiae bacterium GWF2_49_8]OGN57337.1 MAG: hypothetical protein A3D18_02870 [Chlamydiae bacterium RIFCSPHIGHO2_02_FULL_49_29]OGN62806.1 MAG: hypothetical protein A3E26_01555 [Chlamydiae bacterium RIFCSPHIGHO2_12_FULL_49_32]OGN68474.1 MAG: hypothetical protein A3I15_01230 [Chlamydiae bact